MEQWNGGTLVRHRLIKGYKPFKLYHQSRRWRGPLIQHCLILSKPEARTQYSTIPVFHHSPPPADERSELT